MAITTLLIVDDIEIIRDSLSSVLEDEGYEVITAENGKDALKQLENKNVSLIITDILMPEMDGMELVMKTKKLYPKIKFILMSGGGSKTTAGSNYSALDATSRLTKETQILNKPFKPRELIDMVKSIL